MAKLLIEIGCEELPAWACAQALRQLPGLCEGTVGIAPVRTLATARRLAMLFDDVAEQSPSRWVKGPPVALREKAAAGFAKRHGIAAEELEERDGFLGVEVSGWELAESLPGHVDEIVRGLSFGKSMRWDESGLRFPRPVRWRLALVGDRVLVGEGSRGHRFRSGPVEIPSVDSYEETLRKAGVEPDQDKRLAAITAALDELGEWTDPANVLAEVVYLVESPLVIGCSFDERHLQLPKS